MQPFPKSCALSLPHRIPFPNIQVVADRMHSLFANENGLFQVEAISFSFLRLWLKENPQRHVYCALGKQTSLRATHVNRHNRDCHVYLAAESSFGSARSTSTPTCRGIKNCDQPLDMTDLIRPWISSLTQTSHIGLTNRCCHILRLWPI